MLPGAVSSAPYCSQLFLKENLYATQRSGSRQQKNVARHARAFAAV